MQKGMLQMLFPLRSLLALTTALACALTAPAAMAGPSAHPARTAPAFTSQPAIPAPDDMWDFASWDSEHNRLLVAHGKDVLVIDPATRAVRSIGQIGYAHAVLPLPDNQILVTSKLDNTLRILDATSGAEVARIAVDKDPDATVLSKDGHTAYVMAAKAGAISVVDLVRKQQTGRIPLKTGLEVAVLATPTLLAVNSEDFGEIELADLASGKAAGTIPLPGCEGPTGLAMDGQSGLALSACANGKAALVDIVHRKVVAMLPIGMGPDTVIWDAARSRFLIPCGQSGTLAIIALDHGTAHVQSAVATGPGARTAALDPASGTLFLPSARLNPVVKGQPKTVVAGSFRILVLSSR
jgi:DNA-binding beta-propeller fold protein YncE